MTKQITSSANTGAGKLIFVGSILVLLFWITGKTINVYQTAAGGALFEILWFPVIVLSFALPVLALLFWSKDRFQFGSLNFYSLLLTIAAILVMVFYR